jgi:hypothetical protein
MVLAQETEHEEVVQDDPARLGRDPREDLAHVQALGERVEEGAEVVGRVGRVFGRRR